MNLSQRTGPGSLKGGTFLSPGGGSPLNNIGIGLLNAAIRETEDRERRRALGRNIPRPPRVPYAKPGRLAKGLARLAGLGLGGNPYFLGTRIAFNLLMEMPWGNPWAYGPQSTVDQQLLGSGWTLCCDNGGNDNSCYRYVSGRAAGRCADGPDQAPCDYSVNCGVLGQVPSGTADNVILPAHGGYTSAGGDYRYEVLFFGPGTCGGPTAGRMTLNKKFARITLARCNLVPQPTPEIEYKPIAKPPVPVPDLKPPPAATEETFNGDPTPAPVPIPKPYLTPALQFGNGPPKVTHHVWTRPDDRERKRNFPYPTVTKLLAALYDHVTEASQVTDILYDNLGRKCKGAKSMSDKAYCVWKNLDTLDIDAAVMDLIENHYMDKYVWGKIYGTVGKHTDYGSMLPGSKPNFDFGPINWS